MSWPKSWLSSFIRLCRCCASCKARRPHLELTIFKFQLKFAQESRRTAHLSLIDDRIIGFYGGPFLPTFSGSTTPLFPGSVHSPTNHSTLPWMSEVVRGRPGRVDWSGGEGSGRSRKVGRKGPPQVSHQFLQYSVMIRSETLDFGKW